MTLRSSEKKKSEPSDDAMDVDDSGNEDAEILFPWPRFNSQMCIVKNTLFLFGGIIETNKIEHTLSDFWSINLERMDSWNGIMVDPIDLSNWLGDLDSDSSESSNDYDDDEDDQEKKEELERNKRKATLLKNHIENARKQRDDSINVFPHPEETLKEFYTRTVGYWQMRMLNVDDEDVYVVETEGIDGKSGRRNAFKMAKYHYEGWTEKYKEMNLAGGDNDMIPE